MKNTIIFCMILLSSMAYANAPENKLDQAIQAVGEKDWPKAKSLYNELLKTAPDDPQILSNLALISLEEKQPELAFALWQKVLHKQPFFSAATDGIKYLESKGLISNPNSQPSFFLSIISMANRSSVSLTLFVILIFFYLFLKTASSFLLAKKEAKDLEEDPPGFPVKASLYLASCLIFIALALLQQQENKIKYAVSLEESSLYLAPNEESVELAQIPIGKKIKIQRENNEWLQVETAQKERGWLEKKKVFLF